MIQFGHPSLADSLESQTPVPQIVGDFLTLSDTELEHRYSELCSVGSVASEARRLRFNSLVINHDKKPFIDQFLPTELVLQCLLFVSTPTVHFTFPRLSRAAFHRSIQSPQLLGTLQIAFHQFDRLRSHPKPSLLGFVDIPSQQPFAQQV